MRKPLLIGLIVVVLFVTLAGIFLGYSRKTPAPSSSPNDEPSVVLQPTAVWTPAPGALRRSIGLKAGDIAPDFALFDLEGNIIRLYDLKGHIVFINFWATWCPYCRDEMASMERMFQDYKEKGFIILAVDIGGHGETIEKIEKFVEENSLTFSILLDLDGETSRIYKISAVPSTYIIDEEGIIQSVVIGSRNWDLLGNRMSIRGHLGGDNE